MTRPRTDARREEFLGFLQKIVELRGPASDPLAVWGSAEGLVLGMAGEPIEVHDLTLPEGVDLAPVKECFINAYRLSAMNPRYQYAEGFAHAIVSVNHAWCVDTETGAIVDPTWANLSHREPVLYLGLRFTHAFMSRLVVRERQPAIFDADWQRRGKAVRGGFVLDADGAVCEWGDPPPF